MGATSKLRKQVKKKNPQPKPDTTGLAIQMGSAETIGKVDQKKRDQVDDTTAMFLMLIHGKDTRDSVIEMLSAYPDGLKAVPDTAFKLLSKVEQNASRKGVKIPNDVKIASMSYVVPDLLLLGNKARLWEKQEPEESIEPALQATFQLYIEKGLKDKTIDPIQLQAEAEKLMTPEQKQFAMSFGKEGGIPDQPTDTMAAHQFRDQAVQQEQGKQAKLVEENAQLKAALAAEQQNQQQESALAGPAPQQEV